MKMLDIKTYPQGNEDIKNILKMSDHYFQLYACKRIEELEKMLEGGKHMVFCWECPDCGTENRNSVYYAEINTCICQNCKIECEIELEIEVMNISKV